MPRHVSSPVVTTSVTTRIATLPTAKMSPARLSFLFSSFGVWVWISARASPLKGGCGRSAAPDGGSPAGPGRVNGPNRYGRTSINYIDGS